MPNNEWGFGSPLTHFPELEGKIEDKFFSQYRDPNPEMQKKLDNLKNFKKVEKIIEEEDREGDLIKKKITLYVRYK